MRVLGQCPIGQWPSGRPRLAPGHHADAKYGLRDKEIDRLLTSIGGTVLPRHSVLPKIALVCALALAVAGCKNATSIFQDQNEGGWFSKPFDLFDKPEWAKVTGDNKTADLSPKGPVNPDDLVGADGRCSVAAAEPAQAAAPPATDAQPPAGAATPAATPAAANSLDGLQLQPGLPPVMGGIALGMTECQTVARAGQPANVAIGAGEKGERTAVLTYLTGTWPGIYRFSDGRLKIIDRAPAPPEPPKAKPKKKTKKVAKKPAA